MASNDSTATFSGHPAVVGAVRDLIVDRLPGCPRIDDVLWVADELATNAILHSRSGRRDGTFEVVLERSPGGVRLWVTDQGPAPSQVRDEEGIESYERGMEIIDQLSDKWGSDSDDDHTTMWAEFSWE